MIFDVQIVGLRDLKGRFRKMIDADFVAIQLEETQKLALTVEDVFRRNAPRGEKVSKDEDNRPGPFRATIHATAAATPVGFDVHVETEDPQLAMWLREGTGEHGPTGQRITPLFAEVMVARSWSPGGAGPHFWRSIAGMEPQPWEQAAYAEALPIVQEAGRRIGRRVTAALVGGTPL